MSIFNSLTKYNFKNQNKNERSQINMQIRIKIKRTQTFLESQVTDVSINKSVQKIIINILYRYYIIYIIYINIIEENKNLETNEPHILKHKFSQTIG